MRRHGVRRPLRSLSDVRGTSPSTLFSAGRTFLSGQSQVTLDQSRSDPRRLINHRQATARMCAAANQIDAVQIFKAVVGTLVEHLSKDCARRLNVAPR